MRVRRQNVAWRQASAGAPCSQSATCEQKAVWTGVGRGKSMKCPGALQKCLPVGGEGARLVGGRTVGAGVKIAV